MRRLAVNIARGQSNDTYLFINSCIFFLDADLDCQKAKIFPHFNNGFIMANDYFGCGDDRLGTGEMIQLEIKGSDGEWSELLADSPIEAINELIYPARKGNPFA